MTRPLIILTLLLTVFWLLLREPWYALGEFLAEVEARDDL